MCSSYSEYTMEHDVCDTSTATKSTQLLSMADGTPMLRRKTVSKTKMPSTHANKLTHENRITEMPATSSDDKTQISFYPDTRQLSQAVATRIVICLNLNMLCLFVSTFSSLWTFAFY